MQRILAAAVAILILSGSALGDPLPDMKASEMMQRIEKHDVQGLDTFVGVVHGIDWTNSFLVADKKMPIFCPPKGLSISWDQDVEMFETFLKEHADFQPQPFELVMVFVLVDNFPCQK